MNALKKVCYENRVISSLENYMTNEPGETIIILEEFDFLFSRQELAKIKKMWIAGVNLLEISKEIKRDKNEIFLALFHLTFENRKGGGENISLPFKQITD